jgi:hypothetical protein
MLLFHECVKFFMFEQRTRRMHFQRQGVACHASFSTCLEGLHSRPQCKNKTRAHSNRKTKSPEKKAFMQSQKKKLCAKPKKKRERRKCKELHATPASVRALRGFTAVPDANAKHEHTATERPHPLKKKKNFVQSPKKSLCAKPEKKTFVQSQKKRERRKRTQSKKKNFMQSQKKPLCKAKKKPLCKAKKRRNCIKQN